ncbi:PrpF protein [Hypoxylon trugodes]|uniref:PrpF protein n=1 Tax=Hypoxylon trugodes TaxID=326681 RepID=UPI00218F5878|nr:PrpF protein [Hypoxylon trugodes]KAI1387016.1 PrpF protein [Hypoxylon trugodes]
MLFNPNHNKSFQNTMAHLLISRRLTRQCIYSIGKNSGPPNHQIRGMRILETPSTNKTPSRKAQLSLPAAYYRGGTSRAIFFERDVLPQDKSQWDSIFLGAIGSPDPYGRQLDGMGGGISSLSKVCIVGPSPESDTEADVDYTFVSLGIKEPSIDYSSNCGNMSSAVGPFAVDSGLVPIPADATEATVRIRNTNTGKLINATFPVVGGEAAADGDYSIDGVAGTAARVRLDFIKPGGSRTGKLLPTGDPTDRVAGVRATLIDAGNPCVFVAAADLGVDGTLSSQQIDENTALKEKLETIRREAAVRMGLSKTVDDVPGSVPKIGFVSRPNDVSVGNVVVRAMSVGQPHKAIPVTVALAVAAASKIPGTTVEECVVKSESGDQQGIDINHASGKLNVDAVYDSEGQLEAATVFRTARRLMEGRVFWK